MRSADRSGLRTRAARLGPAQLRETTAMGMDLNAVFGHRDQRLGTPRVRPCRAIAGAARAPAGGLDRARGGLVMKPTSPHVDQPRFGAHERNLIFGVVMKIL